MTFNPNATNLSQEQILQQVFNERDNTLSVDAKVTAVIGDVVIEASTSSVTVKDPGTGFILKPNADGSINADIILAAASDSIKSWTQDGAGNPISSTSGSLNVQDKSDGTIGSIAPLVAAQVAAVDSFGNLQALQVDPAGKLLVDITGSSTVTGTVNANIEGLNSFQTSQYIVGTSAVQLTPTPLTNRSSMSIKVKATSNTNAIYVGNSSAVTTATGYILFNGDSLQLDLTPAHSIYAIGSSPGQIVYVLEIGI